MAFLDLCCMDYDNFVKDSQHFASGVFLLENYEHFRQRKNEALFIEGLHQYASLVAENIFGKSPTSSFIPVMVRNMAVNCPADLKKVTLDGMLISAEDFVHVRILQKVSGAIVGEADVFLKKLPIKVGLYNGRFYNYGCDLFVVQRITPSKENITVTFQLNSVHHIFNNHFYDNPICPASMIVEFICDMVSYYGLAGAFTIEQAKFTYPLVPGNDYKLSVNVSGLTVTFCIIDNQGVRCAAGKIIFQ